MNKKLLTLQDLSKFCEDNKLYNFSSKDNDFVIVVQTPGQFSISGETSEGLIPVSLKACHDMTNANGSHIAKEDMETALPSFQLKPILANIVFKDDGTADFGSHDMEIITDPFDSDKKMVHYKESPVGIVYGDASLVYDNEAEVDRVEVKGFLYEEYGNLAVKILEAREGTADVSVELAIKEMTYNAKDKVLNITDFYFDGVTLLGETIQPGMKGSNITLDNFSKENNSLFNSKELIERLERIESKLSSFNIKIPQEGGNESVKLKELLEKYSVSLEELTFETEGLSDEELEIKFAEVFSKEPTPSNDNSKKDKYTINEDGTMTITYEVSHEDIRYALYNLLSSIENSDDEWYYINSVYDGYFVYSTWDEDKIFKHSYSVDDEGNVSIADERTQLFKEYLTLSEKTSLDEMRSNYTAISDELKVYKSAEEKAAKDALFESEDYSSIFDKEEFNELKSNHEDFSLEELTNKLDSLLLTYAKTGALNFAKEEKKHTSKMPLMNAKKSSRYGNLFNKK